MRGEITMDQDERMYEIKNQNIVVEREIIGDRILDIGGGGEGVIGLCYGKNVIAIDPRKDELEEAPDGPLKIVMDARELCFLDNSFDAVTSFFTLMYISKAEHQKVLSEAFRVLKKGGKFILWDAVIPKYHGGVKDIFVIELNITTPHKQINTGYGISFKDVEQDMDYYIRLGEQIGFKVIKTEKQDQIFKVTFKK